MKQSPFSRRKFSRSRYQEEVMFHNIIPLNEIPSKIWTTGLSFVSPLLKSLTNTPVDTLPANVLSEIFMCTLSFNGFGSIAERGRLALEPLILSHVSRRWRSVALSHPQLWATIWVDRPRPPHVPMVEMWLERSQRASLVLYLRQTQQNANFTDPDEHGLTEEIIKRFSSQLYRWYRITLFFSLHTQKSMLLLPDKPDSAPLLQHIHLATNDDWDRESKLKTEKILHSYSALKSLVIHPSTLQVHIHWNRLTELDTTQVGSPVANYITVLKLCRNLITAELRITPDSLDAPFVRPYHRVSLPRLKSFAIHFDHTDAAPLLDCLVLQALEGFALRYTRSHRRSNDANALRQLLARSGPSCVLKRFALQDNPRTRDHTAAHHLAFLQSPQMHGLIELALQIDLCDDVFRFLTLGSVEDGTPRNLPNLEIVSLKDVSGDHVEDLELYRMVVSRLGQKTPLYGAVFNLCLNGHSESRILPLLFERCRNSRVQLKVYLASCEDANSTSGWYTSEPIPGGYLTDVA
ncbi:hypothetical protein MIND_00111900 [Mycena indigotica]|uniref:F-box domain-containing protein n=1 Tax=Mycena indigotica TaxID=2126181 RepID=A0A8H6TEL1_9AGAR|nr:uncharacterized protein MIND_00111900 [Mycena indigotica]KAF7315951.1 hypothetical protein MIND_00111900 [Mycena indigotica]